MFRFDTHMHFDLYKDRLAMLEYLENNKSYTIAVTNLPELYQRYRGLDKNYKFVNIALGFHPELMVEYENQLPLFAQYVYEARYIGEIGLDYSDGINKEKKKEIFAYIIFLLKQYDDKILTVHSRKAEKDVIDITRDFPGTVIMHWYSGTKSYLKQAIEEGKYFSINQQMVRSKNGREIIQTIPVERMLIESDAPFTKGLEKEYDVGFMDIIYKEIAEIKHISADELNGIFRENFKAILLKNR